MGERRFPCCVHCKAAKDDHVEHGGTVEKDRHDLPCDTCLYDAEVERRVAQRLAAITALTTAALAEHRRGCPTYGLVSARQINDLIEEATHG